MIAFILLLPFMIVWGLFWLVIMIIGAVIVCPLEWVYYKYFWKGRHNVK